MDTVRYNPSDPVETDHPAVAAALVRAALRADSATRRYADELAIGTIGRTVALRGVVDDLDDSDNVIEVAGRVVGFDHIVDELEVRALFQSRQVNPAF